MRWTARRAAGAVTGLLAVAGVVLAVEAVVAQRHLEDARDRVPVLRAALGDGDLDGARAVLSRVQQDAAAARGATDGPLWDGLAAVPWAGRTAASVQRLTSTTDDLAADVLPGLLDVAEDLAPARLRPAPDRLDLSAISASVAPLARARTQLTAMADRLATAQSAVLPAVAAAERELAADLRRLQQAVDGAGRAARLLPDALGASGPRRYFVAFQGTAEARGTGGLVGAYGILVADHGRLAVPVLGDDRDLHGLPPVRRPFGAEYAALYGRDPELWANTNLSPHFPYAAQLWLAMWARRTGQHLDGALATDPNALRDLLEVTGPVRLPDGEQVRAESVVALTQRDAYARFGAQQDARKDFLVDVARAVVDAALGGVPVDGQLSALRAAVAERRLLAWSAHPEEQGALERTPLSGAVPEDGAPYAAVVVNNASGNKLDYYLEREVRYELGGCQDGARATTVRVRLTNQVPPQALPAYVVARHDLPRGSRWRPGSTKLHVALYATRGAALVRAELDGARTGVRVGRERGHPVFVLDVVLEPRQPRELVFSLLEPAVAGPVRVPEQPLVLRQRTQVSDATCAGAVVSVARADDSDGQPDPS